MTVKIERGGYAFPTLTLQKRLESGEAAYITEGMTLRDYFAAKAMQGSLASDDDINYSDKFAEWCYEIADAMIKAREQA